MDSRLLLLGECHGLVQTRFQRLRTERNGRCKHRGTSRQRLFSLLSHGYRVGRFGNRHLLEHRRRRFHALGVSSDGLRDGLAAPGLHERDDLLGARLSDSQVRLDASLLIGRHCEANFLDCRLDRIQEIARERVLTRGCHHPELKDECACETDSEKSRLPAPGEAGEMREDADRRGRYRERPLEDRLRATDSCRRRLGGLPLLQQLLNCV